MPWASLIVLLIQVIAKRRGWLGAALAAAKDHILTLLPADAVTVGGAVFAAPESLQAAVEKILDDLLAKADRPLVKLFLRAAKATLPGVIDALWDALFEQGKVTHRHPVQLAATVDYEPEDVELTAAVAEHLAV